MPRRSRSLCYLSVDSLLIQVNATMYIASLIHKKKKDATHEYPKTNDQIKHKEHEDTCGHVVLKPSRSVAN